jgi:hypothetical protein
MNSNLESNLVVSNRKFIDNDTSEIVDKYIDENTGIIRRNRR